MPSALLSDFANVDTTVFESFDDGDPENVEHSGAQVPWHRRIGSGVWLWLIVVGAIGALWAIGGSFRKILS